MSVSVARLVAGAKGEKKQKKKKKKRTADAPQHTPRDAAPQLRPRTHPSARLSNSSHAQNSVSQAWPSWPPPALPLAFCIFSGLQRERECVSDVTGDVTRRPSHLT